MRAKSHSSSMATSAGAIETEKSSQYASARTCHQILLMDGQRCWVSIAGATARLPDLLLRLVCGHHQQYHLDTVDGATETEKCSQYASARTCRQSLC